MLIRPYTELTATADDITLQSPPKIIGDPVVTLQHVEDFVLPESLEPLREVWLESVRNTTETLFFEEDDDLTPDERVLQAAAKAAFRIDNALKEQRIREMEWPVPSRYGIKIPQNVELGIKAIQELVPFARLQNLLLQRLEQAPGKTAMVEFEPTLQRTLGYGSA
jgi:hypothetical protein